MRRNETQKTYCSDLSSPHVLEIDLKDFLFKLKKQFLKINIYCTKFPWEVLLLWLSSSNHISLPELKIQRRLLALVTQKFNPNTQEAEAGFSFIFRVLQNVLSSEFETSLVYSVGSRIARATQRNSFLKNNIY